MSQTNNNDTHENWTWTVCRRGAEIARGEAPDAETALRSGLFAAGAIEALARAADRVG